MAGNARQERHQTAVELVVEGLSDQKIADRLGVNPATVWKWRQKEEFKRRVIEARRERYGALRLSAEHWGKPCLQVLAKIALDGRARNADRIKAAAEILRITGVTADQEVAGVPKQEIALSGTVTTDVSRMSNEQLLAIIAPVVHRVGRHHRAGRPPGRR